MIIIIPGQLIALVTWPGVVMHEIAHRLACDILNVPVYEVKYFSISWSSRVGYVHHQKIDCPSDAFLIGIAPLFTNSILCMLFTLPFTAFIYTGGALVTSRTILSAFLWWIGMSMGITALPSNQDVNNALSVARENNGSYFIRFMCYCIKFLNFFEPIFGLLYTFIISFILPVIILR